jgi:membrane-associated phospholipid phosphatase
MGGMLENAHDENGEPGGHGERLDARRMSRVWPLVGGLVALLLAIALGAAILLGNHGRPLLIDAAWMNTLLRLRTPFGVDVALVFNAVGGGFIATFLVPIGITVLFLVAKRPWTASYYLLATVLGAGLVQVLKQLFGRARPEEILVHADFGSFPSGHAANAAVMAAVLFIVFPRVWVGIAGAIYTVAMMLSRNYLGAHWLSDTVGGLLLGVGVALVLWAAFCPRVEAETILARERSAR